jgi:starch-binding outer membrane protein, SusD/RagB family
MTKLWKNRLGCAAMAALLVSASAGCDLEVGDLNNVALDDLLEDPQPTTVNAATTGLLIGYRAGNSASNGYVVQLGILGREAYNFDGADPRYILELLIGKLAAGSPFGGAFWAGPYANIKQGKLILEAVPKVAVFSDAEKAGINGFTKTIIALELLRIINTRDDIGAVIDIQADLDQPLGAIVDKAAVFAEIASQLDAAKADLQAAGDAPFTFALTSGFAGFDDPAGFLQFNRAMRARVAVYMEDYATALTALSESFLNTETLTLEELDVGVYHVYSTAQGDVTTGLINPNIYAHPALEADAQTKAGGAKDDRFTRKITKVTPGTARRITSDLKFTMYTAPDSPAPIIRNEELILLRAEARLGLNMLADARADLDLVRDVSGGLPPLAAGSTAEQLEEEVVYNRRYSLMFEGGHRWIDARRFGRIAELKAEDPNVDDPMTTDVVETLGPVNVRYPITQDECNARPTEAKCDLESQP